MITQGLGVSIMGRAIEKDLISFNKKLELKEQIQNDEYALQSYIRWQNENREG